ncbi:MAG TPA: SAM-dependent methyltransferase [Pyrinomonadaceae bacterium]|nr:SAM-dependent methyltransferase [Acidobacteriota bacterium]HQZ96548.1 SAM-dependent methyltransferase [Pyrinomonadaceae bacterium]
MSENADKFLGTLAESLEKQTFVKLTLGNYKGPDDQLQKMLVRLVTTKKGTRLYFLYRGATRDTAKNYDLDTGIALIGDALDNGFRSAHLFTTEHDYQLELGKKGKSRLNVGKPTFTAAPAATHDRDKKEQVDPNSFYLRSLGITDDNGRVRDRDQHKWRQINKFVEVLASLVDKSELKDRKQLRIVDMGSGKGYLTFAAYDYFKNTRKVDVQMTGVDTKSELVELGNGIAAAAGFEGLNFVVGSIANYDVGDVDILIALHACNTATDDAIFKGITAKADLIVAAPCCHQEIRPQIKPPAMLRDILKHGVMLERTAETLTDGLRSLLLERSGYSTKLFEFVALEHTPKNNMLVGTRLKKPTEPEQFEQQIAEIKAFYGIEKQHLETLLKKSDPT